jgi:diadenylate cyclase
MSENSDAVVVVVSEETGTISVASKGELKRGYDSITLKTELEALLVGDRFDKKKNESKIKVWKRWSK